MFGKVGKQFAGQIAGHVESAVSQHLSSKTPQSTETATESMGKITGKRRALFIGINYYGQKGELRGCINDVNNIKKYLSTNYRLDEVMVLTDDPKNKDPKKIPTRANILAAFKWLRNGAKAGDSLIFHYSGHGGSQKVCIFLGFTLTLFCHPYLISTVSSALSRTLMATRRMGWMRLSFPSITKRLE